MEPRYASQESRDENVGKGALFILQSVVPSEEPVKILLLLARAVPVVDADLISLLSSVTKPITCVSFRHHSALAIGWWPTDRDIADAHRRMNSELLDDLSLKLSERESESRVVLSGSPGTLDLSFREVRQLMSNYYFPFAEYRFHISHEAEPSSPARVHIRVTPTTFGEWPTQSDRNAS